MIAVPPARVPQLRRWLEELGPSTTGLLAHRNLRYFADASGDPGNGVVSVRDHSVLYPVFPSTSAALPELEPSEWGLHDSICVMGPTPWVQPVEVALGGRPWTVLRVVDYDFLVRPAPPGPWPPLPEGVRRARPRDAARLFTLQEGYEKEEVLFSPAEFQPLASWLALQKALKEQLFVVLQREGRPVAMARTNARYGSWAQLGGVYTQPAWRRQGLQRVLIAALVATLAAEGQGACLFVKTANVAAKALYREAGFHEGGSFRISYWSRQRGG